MSGLLEILQRKLLFLDFDGLSVLGAIAIVSAANSYVS